MGGGNFLEIEQGATLTHCRFLLHGHNNRIIIHKGARLNETTFFTEHDNNMIEIGACTTTNANVHFEACEGRKITVGEDCMFSINIAIRTSDYHSILNKEGMRTNRAKDIKIGNHVWVGFDCSIMKGSMIENNCIVAAGSMVTSSSKSKSSTLLAGTPAKPIREEISWSRKIL